MGGIVMSRYRRSKGCRPGPMRGELDRSVPRRCGARRSAFWSFSGWTTMRLARSWSAFQLPFSWQLNGSERAKLVDMAANVMATERAIKKATAGAGRYGVSSTTTRVARNWWVKRGRVLWGVGISCDSPCHLFFKLLIIEFSATIKIMSKKNNKKKVGIVLLVFAIFAMAVLGILMYKNSTDKNQTSNASPTPTPAETVNPSAVVSAVPCKTPDVDSTLYVNKTYGFSVNFPSSWNDRKINETAGNSTGVVDQVEVQLKSNSKYITALTIYVYKKSCGTAQIRAAAIRPNYSKWHLRLRLLGLGANPSDLPTVTDKDFVKIIDSFKLIK